MALTLMTPTTTPLNGAICVTITCDASPCAVDVECMDVWLQGTV
jgi:hypothetical protein